MRMARRNEKVEMSGNRPTDWKADRPRQGTAHRKPASALSVQKEQATNISELRAQDLGEGSGRGPF